MLFDQKPSLGELIVYNVSFSLLTFTQENTPVVLERVDGVTSCVPFESKVPSFPVTIGEEDLESSVLGPQIPIPSSVAEDYPLGPVCSDPSLSTHKTRFLRGPVFYLYRRGSVDTSRHQRSTE